MLESSLSFDREQHPRRPNLHHLLRKELPRLGLDVDMYGPYVWGDEDETDSDDDKDDDDLKDIVLGVLQASSETHADDDEVWNKLFEDILTAKELDSSYRKKIKEQHLQETKTKLEEELARAKLEEAEEKPKEKSSQVDEETKRLLLQRYAYDETEEDAEGNAGGGSKSAAPTTAPTNRDAAKAAHLEKAREIRSNYKTTKAEERKKTKEQKASKAELKEARRKRAQKGERRA